MHFWIAYSHQYKRNLLLISYSFLCARVLFELAFNISNKNFINLEHWTISNDEQWLKKILPCIRLSLFASIVHRFFNKRTSLTGKKMLHLSICLRKEIEIEIYCYQISYGIWLCCWMRVRRSIYVHVHLSVNDRVRISLYNSLTLKIFSNSVTFKWKYWKLSSLQL